MDDLQHNLDPNNSHSISSVSRGRCDRIQGIKRSEQSNQTCGAAMDGPRPAGPEFPSDGPGRKCGGI